MASSSSSSSAAAKLFAVKYYATDTGKAFPTFIGWVDIPVLSGPDVVQSIPPVLTINNNTYFWSMVRFGYVQIVPYVATVDSTPPVQPILSVVCNPQM